MKKIVLLLACILMTLACVAIAEDEPTVFTYGDFDYILLDDDTAEITDYTGNSKKVDIPELLNGYVVTSIGEDAFAWCSSTEITIPNSVTSIGNFAFAWCSFTEITIPNSVTSIGRNPFIYCFSLANIKVSPMHKTLITIDGVLYDKRTRSLICYPFALEANSYSIPQGISAIGENAFCHCYFLTEIIIPDSVTFIGDLAFVDCDSLTEITIPDGVTYIGFNPFYGCNKLTKIKVSPDHSTFATIDNVLFDKREKKLICYPNAVTAKSYSIPHGIASIGDWAFLYCRSLTSVTIPDSVTSIGNYAFNYCDSLTEITIPDSVTSIGDDAFYSCDSLTLTVERGSYALQYAKENNIEYTYTDALDWLNS